MCQNIKSPWLCPNPSLHHSLTWHPVLLFNSCHPQTNKHLMERMEKPRREHTASTSLHCAALLRTPQAPGNYCILTLPIKKLSNVRKSWSCFFIISAIKGIELNETSFVSRHGYLIKKKKKTYCDKKFTLNSSKKWKVWTSLLITWELNWYSPVHLNKLVCFFPPHARFSSESDTVSWSLLALARQSLWFIEQLE